MGTLKKPCLCFCLSASDSDRCVALRASLSIFDIYQFYLYQIKTNHILKMSQQSGQSDAPTKHTHQTSIIYRLRVNNCSKSDVQYLQSWYAQALAQFFHIIISQLDKSMIKKSAFLQKKTQEKQVIQEQQKNKLNALKVQKNIRAFLLRKTMIEQSNSDHQIKLSIIMNKEIEAKRCEEVFSLLGGLKQSSQSSRHYYYSKFIIKNMHREEFYLNCIDILSAKGNQKLKEDIFKREQFLKILETKLSNKQGFCLLNLSAEILYNSSNLDKISDTVLLQSILNQFQQAFIQIQSPYGSNLQRNVINIILTHLAHRKVKICQNINPYALHSLLTNYIKLLNFNRAMQSQDYFTEEQLLTFWLQYFMNVGIMKHEQIANILIQQNRHIVSLVEDVQLLEQIEQKLRQKQEMEEFSNEYVNYMKSLVTNEFIIYMFTSKTYRKIKLTLLGIINDLGRLFEDRKLLFIRYLISSDKMLINLMESKDEMFYQALKMKLIPMDDQEFQEFALFTPEHWKNIIKHIIDSAENKIKRIQELQRTKMETQALIPFKKRKTEHLQLKTLVDLMNNLCKKNLRVKKFNPQIFIQSQLSQNLNNFLFGKSSILEELLKNMPFIFSFQSRIAKFKELVKDDKKNHNRILYMNAQEITISVRRGREFQDAFEACMNKDLRRKYKIVFYNEQGFQQEGIDGGGIIKQFINRVMKASFSEQYGLFMETSLNEALPNPYSQYDVQYQFVGKLVGKAVYEGITIEQKFAEPFLNLVIGRQNTFEDLHYIDPDIYRGLLNIKNTTDDISELQQTFVIYDKLPNGQAKYVDLLCPNKEVTYATKEVYVTEQNKLQFILGYSDFKCNKQIAEKSRLFRKGFLKVMKPEWLTMFSNQELNSIISGSHPDFDVNQLKANIIYNGYTEKDETIICLWEVLSQLSVQDKSLFLLYITSCPRPPTLGFGSMSPKICIRREHDPTRLPTAVTCMNILKLPNYKDKQVLRHKLLYAIKAKAGFQFA